MKSVIFFLTTVLVTLHSLTLVHANLYVVEPLNGTTWHSGEPATITWLDDGKTPLLSSIGVVTVGLYTGHRQLLQSLGTVDVASSLSFTFTPNPQAGPDSGAYYIGFTSTSLQENSTEAWTGYSPWFSLDRMTGSFDTPIPSLTAPIPVSFTTTTRTILSTITVGTLSTAVPSPAAPNPASSTDITTEETASSRLSTFRITATSPTSSAPSPTASNVQANDDGNNEDDAGGAALTSAFIWATVILPMIVMLAV